MNESLKALRQDLKVAQGIVSRLESAIASLSGEAPAGRTRRSVIDAVSPARNKAGKRRGRPPGSTNKPKPEAAPAAEAATTL